MNRWWRDVPPPTTVGVCEGCGGPWWVDEDDREQGCVTDGCPGYIDRPRRQRPESYDDRDLDSVTSNPSLSDRAAVG